MINEKKLDNALLVCGLRDSLIGTEYIRSAVRLYRAGMAYSKELYPAVAKQFHSTASRVERSMRHAIESGFDRCGYDIDVLEMFGNSIDPNRGKPTVSEFISRVARLCNED